MTKPDVFWSCHLSRKWYSTQAIIVTVSCTRRDWSKTGAWAITNGDVLRKACGLTYHPCHPLSQIWTRNKEWPHSSRRISLHGERLTWTSLSTKYVITLFPFIDFIMTFSRLVQWSNMWSTHPHCRIVVFLCFGWINWTNQCLAVECKSRDLPGTMHLTQQRPLWMLMLSAHTMAFMFCGFLTNCIYLSHKL